MRCPMQSKMASFTPSSPIWQYTFFSTAAVPFWKVAARHSNLAAMLGSGCHSVVLGECEETSRFFASTLA